MLCITKAMLFVVICAVLLYTPLGNPQEVCPTRSYGHKNLAYYCLCNFYKLFKETANDMTQAADALLCLTLDGLYDVKLKFYSLLRTLDKEDLCRLVCCSNDEENSSDKEKRLCPGCRCLESCNSGSQK